MKAFNDETTLYGRTLTVELSCGGERATEIWREKLYDPGDNRDRAEIQAREWRIGRGEGTEADHRAAITSEFLRRSDD